MTGSSTSSNAKRGKCKVRKVKPRQMQYSGPSFSDLPNNILENIIVRLSIKMIILCKCVCKTWKDIISEPEFAKLHFEQAQISPLLRNSGVAFTSRMLYLVQPDQAEFKHKLDFCDHMYPHRRCHLCQLKVKLDTKFKLPFRNLKKILDDHMEVSGRVKDNAFKLKMKDHKYKVVNSCNGLLCLSDPSDNDPVIVCNPVTGEFINLPKARTSKLPVPYYYPGIACGFGSGRTSNKYKVVRMLLNKSADRSISVPISVAEVYVLGTKLWKNRGSFIFSLLKLFPTYLNGCVYWLAEDCVILFDIDTEHFDSLLSPLSRINENVAMGVLGGELCISKADKDEINLWVLKDTCTENNWSKLFSICQFPGIQQWPHGSFLPIRFLKVRGVESKLEAIPHIPSFIALKDIISGHNVRVFNIKSRCAGLKVYKEEKGVSIVEDMNYAI